MIHTILSQLSVALLYICLYDRAKHLITKPSTIANEKKHLSSVLVSNGYPSLFVQKITKTKRPTSKEEPKQDFKYTAVLPCIKRVTEVLRLCLQQQGIRTVFKSDTTLKAHLVRPKDALDSSKQDGVVYKIPCESRLSLQPWMSRCARDSPHLTAGRTGLVIV